MVPVSDEYQVGSVISVCLNMKFSLFCIVLSQEDQNAFSQPIVSTGSHDLTTEEPSAETTIECQYKSPPSTVESINLRENESILKVWERAQRIVRIPESVTVIMNSLLTGKYCFVQ